MATGQNYVVLTAPAPLLAAGVSAFDSAVTAPAPTLVATMPQLGAFTGSAPVPTIDSFMIVSVASIAVTAPAPTLTSVIGVVITAELAAPPPRLSADVLSGNVLTFTNSAPMPVLDIGTKDFINTAQAPVLAATLLSGTLITVSASAAAPLLSATLINPAIITAANTAPTPQLSAALASGNIIAAALTASAPTLSATALTGTISSMIFRAATPIMEASGYPAYTITFAGAAPAPRLDSTLSSAILENYRTWVLNTRKGVIGEYDNFEFNSYGVFNGKVIACGPAGLFELGQQDTDAGVPIDATATLGQESFSSSLHKRVPRIYLGHSATGDLHFSTITVEGGTRTYLLKWNGLHGTQQRRIPVGKGPRSRFWQFSVSNIDGAAFDLSDLLVYTVKLKRRVM